MAIILLVVVKMAKNREQRRREAKENHKSKDAIIAATKKMAYIRMIQKLRALEEKIDNERTTEGNS